MNTTNIDSMLMTKSFKVFNTSILLMDEMKSVVISQANSIINNLNSELSEILSYNAGRTSIVYNEKLKEYTKMFGEGAIQTLSFDAILYSVSNFGKFLSFVLEFSPQYQDTELRSIPTTVDLRNELYILKDGISKKLGLKIPKTALLNYMIEFLIKEKDLKIAYVVLPTEVSYLSYKIKNERNGLARGYKRRIMHCIYSKILIQMIKGLYNKDLTLKDDVVMNLITDESEISKSKETFKEIEIRSREELNDMLVAGRNKSDKPKLKFDLSLLNEEEQTMREAINGFMIPYGNRYIYEDEANFIVGLLNKVANNNVSLQQLKAALV